MKKHVLEQIVGDHLAEAAAFAKCTPSNLRRIMQRKNFSVRIPLAFAKAIKADELSCLAVFCGLNYEAAAVALAFSLAVVGKEARK